MELVIFISGVLVGFLMFSKGFNCTERVVSYKNMTHKPKTKARTQDYRSPSPVRPNTTSSIKHFIK